MKLIVVAGENQYKSELRVVNAVDNINSFLYGGESRLSFDTKHAFLKMVNMHHQIF